MGRGRSAKSLALVDAAYNILEDIQPATVRAVCYQLFVRGLIRGMDKVSTNRVGSLLTRAREEDEIPWGWIVQEGRAIESLPSWNDPAAFARAVQHSYRRNKWLGQPKRVIVVSEKGTVRGTLAPVLEEYEVEFLPVGGYASATRVRELADQHTDERPLLLLYLGDHDPSGRGMSDQDLPKRLVRYLSVDPADKGWSDEQVELALEEEGLEVRRIALTDEDLVLVGPRLGFPARDKAADPRYAWFTRRYGSWCWELDAMNPNALRTRVAEAVQDELDQAQWDRYVTAEQIERESIEQTCQTWASISRLAPE
jgi:hypothetical protein